MRRIEAESDVVRIRALYWGDRLHGPGFAARLARVTDSLDFDGVLWRPDPKSAVTFVTLPFDVKALFGRARCPVRVTINEHTWRTTTQIYGDSYQIVVSAAARVAAAASAGDAVRVQIKKDATVRSADVPVELAVRLRCDAEAKDAFEALPAAHRREYSQWITEAELPQTRVRRAEAAVERLKTGVRRPRSA